MTWIGHATCLLQVDGLSLLTDPVFGERASPLSWAGPARFSPPGLGIDELPPVDGVLLSHDHYDHLDRRSADALLARFGPELPWYTPLGYREWFAARGARRVTELDWWEEVPLEGASGRWRLVSLPVRHWTRRGLRARTRLWSSWALLPGEPGRQPAPPGDAKPRPRGLYFVGDSGYCPAFAEIGRRLGPFRASLLPVGAYAPRWFMAPSHMNPEEAVRAYRDLGGKGAFVGLHWGTFRLTDEDPLEPPRRTRTAWDEATLSPKRLHLPGIGGTVVLDAGEGRPKERAGSSGAGASPEGADAGATEGRDGSGASPGAAP